jgi:hypothetical protein
LQRHEALDEVAHNGEWKTSNSEVALCGPGEALLGTGFAFTESGINSQGTFLRALPILTSPSSGVMGQIISGPGGSAKAEIIAPAWAAGERTRPVHLGAGRARVSHRPAYGADDWHGCRASGCRRQGGLRPRADRDEFIVGIDEEEAPEFRNGVMRVVSGLLEPAAFDSLYERH